MEFARYPAYKASGVDWLGQVPAHWEVRQIKTVASCNDDVLAESTPDDYEIEYVEISDVQAGLGITGSSTLSFKSAPSRARRLLRNQDVLISTVRTYLRAIAQVKDAPANLVGSTGFAVLRPRAINSHFLGYACTTEGFIGTVIARSVGVSYPAINAADLIRLDIPVPPLEEQTAIAAFLDRETARIDALVAEQQRLIGLLREKRQATITRAVTRGLDPGAPLKDSGVEWLGQVPAHWEVERLRRIAMVNPPKAEAQSLPPDTEVSFLPMEAIGDDGTIALDRTRPIAEVTSGYTYFRDGDVAIAKITPCFENGKGAVMHDLTGGIGFGTTELIVARPDPAKVTSSYLDRIFNSRLFRQLGEGAMYGAGGQKRVPDDFVRNFAIGIPPFEEQTAIAAFLDRKTARIAALMAETERSIALLQERRAALISAAVTGQIDVRGAVPAPATA